MTSWSSAKFLQIFRFLRKFIFDVLVAYSATFYHIFWFLWKFIFQQHNTLQNFNKFPDCSENSFFNVTILNIILPNFTKIHFSTSQYSQNFTKFYDFSENSFFNVTILCKILPNFRILWKLIFRRHDTLQNFTNQHFWLLWKFSFQCHDTLSNYFLKSDWSWSLFYRPRICASFFYYYHSLYFHLKSRDNYLALFS